MRIIAAEVAIAPENHPEVEVGMLPLDLDLPGPPPTAAEMSSEERLEITHTQAGRRAALQAALNAGVLGSGRTVNVRLTLHTSRGDLTIRQQVVLRAEKPDESGDADWMNLPERQHQALLRSVERPPRGDDLLEIHARLPRRPIAPSDHAMAEFPIS